MIATARLPLLQRARIRATRPPDAPNESDADILLWMKIGAAVNQRIATGRIVCIAVEKIFNQDYK